MSQATRSHADTTPDLPTELVVEGLFSRFSYKIPLPNPNNRITFLIAPNGYGKSTALRIIDALASMDLLSLSRIHFDRASISFQSGRTLTITSNEREDPQSGHLSLSHKDAHNTIDQKSIPFAQIRNIIEDHLPHWIRQIGPDQYLDTSTEEILSQEDLRIGFNHHLRSLRILPNSFLEAIKDLSVYYLDANRLRGSLRDDPYTSSRHRARYAKRRSETILEVSKLIGEEIRRSRHEYASASREAERKFPHKILERLRPLTGTQQNHSLSGDTSIKERHERLREKDTQYQSLSLTDGNLDYIPDYQLRDLMQDRTAQIILGQYLDDIEHRFHLLEPAARRLSIFQTTINSMLENKKVEFVYTPEPGPDQHLGLLVRDDQEREIPLPSLSSGEQHLVVMFGRILFERRARGGALILLDEPEISLHPEWQILLREAFKEVAEANDCVMLLATHSPIMIGEEWDSVVDLSTERAKR